ncbi:hypothetical protein AAEJ42_23130, partial [Shewanella algae]|uniref:hypothetical protein n=1 Tax=Shewanella algae TaxID=38313 RepID=UPI00313EDF7E
TPGEFAEYTTTNLFQTISASSVILGSGLTNGTIAVYGIYGAKARTLLGETKFMDKFAEHSPQLQRGLYARDYNLIRLAHDPE